MNRRDFLKVSALAACTSLLPTLKFKGAENWLADLVATADAAWPSYPKKIWNARLNTNMPDLYALYGWIDVPQFTRASDPAYLSTWPVGTDEPSESWHQNFAAVVRSYNLPVKAIHVDHEEWLISTQAERLATATKFANFARTFKTNLPDYQIGFYGYSEINSFVPNTYPGTGAFATFQSKNNDMAAMYQDVDYFCPSFYWPYRRSADPTYPKDYQVKNHIIVHALEQRRLAHVYGHDQPIYPYVWERDGVGSGVGTLQDFDIIELIYQTTYQYADGMTIWGGFHDSTGAQVQQTWAQDTAANAQGAWWNNVLGPRASSGRYWGPADGNRP